MILRDNTEIQGLIEPLSNSYIYGDTDRSVVGLAFEQAYKNSITGWAVDKLNERLDTAMGYQQDLVSVEDAKNTWGLDIDEPETLSKIRHKARLNSFNRYSDLSQQIAQESNGTAYNWTSTIGGVLAGSFFDPLLLVSSLGVGNGIKAIGTSIKPIAKALYSSNPFIKHASRFGLFGGSDIGFNIVTGKIISKNRGQDEYTSTDYAFDVALGAIIGPFIGSRMLKAHKIKLNNKLVSPDDVKELPFFSKSTSPKEGVIAKEGVKLDKSFVEEVKGLSSSDVATAKAIDYYDKMAHSGDYNQLSNAEKNIMTFIKANQLNGAVNSEYLGSFLGVRENFDNLIRKAYGYIPDSGPQGVKSFSASVENNIANIINSISKNTGIPKTTDAMNAELAPFYKNLTSEGDSYSGKGLAAGVKEIADENIAKLSLKGISGSVASGLDTLFKLRPFKRTADTVKKPKLPGAKPVVEEVSPVVEALKADKANSSVYKSYVNSFSEQIKSVNDSGIDIVGSSVMADIDRLPTGIQKNMIVSDVVEAIFASSTISNEKKFALTTKFYNRFPTSLSMSELYNKYTEAIKAIKEGKLKKGQ